MESSCKDFINANEAVLQAHSILEISQEAFTDPDSENIYNLLNILDEKVKVVLNYFDNHELSLRRIG
jgi:hypothetical protein